MNHVDMSCKVHNSVLATALSLMLAQYRHARSDSEYPLRALTRTSLVNLCVNALGEKVQYQWNGNGGTDDLQSQDAGHHRRVAAHLLGQHIGSRSRRHRTT